MEPSYAPMAQQGFRKDQRAKQARATISKTIPQIVASDARARKGIENACLFPGSPSNSSSKPHRSRKHKKASVDSTSGSEDPKATEVQSASSDDTTAVSIRIQIADTLTAARDLHQSSKSKRNVAILNMASPLRPGGGVLNGATSQEESLCSRTTLLPCLKEEWYRLPEVGGIWSPDVLVFRLLGSKGDEELSRTERFYVDVISSAMTRFPDVIEHEIKTVNESNDEDSENEDNVTIKKKYANQKDRDLALEKMRAVLSMLIAQKTERVVLGAWGCGAYGNPINEICAAWKRAILGTKSQSAKRKDHQIVDLGGIKEIVFAIKDVRMAREFARYWGDEVEVVEVQTSSRRSADRDVREEHVRELEEKIHALQLQMSEVKTPILRQGLEGTLQTLKLELEKVFQERGEEEDTEED